jgi:hypothetical protein
LGVRGLARGRSLHRRLSKCLERKICTSISRKRKRFFSQMRSLAMLMSLTLSHLATLVDLM